MIIQRIKEPGDDVCACVCVVVKTRFYIHCTFANAAGLLALKVLERGIIAIAFLFVMLTFLCTIAIAPWSCKKKKTKKQKKHQRPYGNFDGYKSVLAVLKELITSSQEYIKIVKEGNVIVLFLCLNCFTEAIRVDN